MSNEDKTAGGGGDGTFLARWSQRKRAAARGQADADDDPPAMGDGAAPATGESSPGAPELPPLESLGDDSDYSLFMNAGVEEGVRTQALRRLFRTAKFNVRDGLCEYDDDYTQLTPLGEWAVAKLREQRQRWAQAGEQWLSDDMPTDRPAHGGPSGENATDGDDPSQA